MRRLLLASPAYWETPARRERRVCRGRGVHGRNDRVVCVCSCESTRDNNQYTGLWLWPKSLNSPLFKAADMCLDSKTSQLAI